MDFKHLEAFVCVVRFNSFTKSAEHLHLTQPTISSQIRQLEEELGTPLLIRTTKSLRLTDAGEEFFGYASDILALRERASTRWSDPAAQLIHIGTSTIPSSYLLPKAISDYRKSNPDVHFQLHQGDSQNVIKNLLDGMFDIGIIGTECADPALSSSLLSMDTMTLILPATQEYRNLLKRDDLAEELLRYPFILRESGSGSLKSAETFLRILGVDPQKLNVVVRTDDQESIKHMVSAGLGISVISDLAVVNEAASGSLLTYTPDNAILQRGFYLVSRKDAFIPESVDRFASFLRAYLKKE